MAEKTFCFTFQPFTPANQNYSSQEAVLNFAASTVLVDLWLQTSTFPEFQDIKINRLKINRM